MYPWGLFGPIVGISTLLHVLFAPFIVVYLYVTKKHSCTQNRLDGKVVIVTGSNTGIGKEAAAILSRRGAKVVLACRDVEKAKCVASRIGQGCLVEKLDLNDLGSVHDFAERMKKKFPEGISVLINNAGLNTTGKTAQGVEQMWGVNYLGHYYLTRLLLPLIGDTIVNVASVCHRFAPAQLGSQDPKTSYAESKFAMILLTLKLQRLHPTLCCHSPNPGAVNSDIWRSWKFGSLGRSLMRLLLLTPAQGAATLVAAAAGDVPRDALYLSPYWGPDTWGMPFDAMGVFVGARVCPVEAPREGLVVAADKLWRESEEHLKALGFPLSQ